MPTLSKFLIIVLVVFTGVVKAQKPINVYRSAPSVTVNDAYTHSYKGMGLPILPDTASGLNGQLDSLGRMFYNKGDGKVYVRDTVATGGHKWTPIGTGSAGGTISTANSVVGTGASGSPVQLKGDASSPGVKKYYGTDVSGTNGFYDLNKSIVGLDQVDNTPDAGKPVSTAVQTALNAKVTNILNASGLGFGPYSSIPSTGTGFYFSTTDSSWYWWNGASNTNISGIQAIVLRGLGQPGDTTIVKAMGSNLMVAAVRDSVGAGQVVKHLVNADGSWTFYNAAVTTTNYWSRTGTTISTATAGDNLSLGGTVGVDVTNTASSNFTGFNLTVRNGFAASIFYGFRVAPIINATATSAAGIIIDGTSTPTAAVTNTNLLNIQLGVSTNWGTKRGISVTGSGSGTNERGFETNVAAGTGNYAINATGTAPLFFQGALGINQTAVPATVQLDVVADNTNLKGTRPFPQYTTAQITSFASLPPAPFTMVVNLDSVGNGHPIYYWDGVAAQWRNLANASATSSSSLSYKAIAFGNSSNLIAGDTLKIKHDSATNGHTYLNVNRGPMNSGLTSYFYGNSETFGFPTPTTYLPYPQQVSNKLGHTISNQAISGRTLQNTGWSGATGYILQDTSSIPTYNSSTSGFLFNNIGVNDIRANVSGNDSASFRTAYRLWVIAALRKGWPAYRVVLISPVFIPNSTFKNDSITYSFTAAASQARAVGFNISVQAVVNEFSLRYADGYGATFAMNDFYQADSLHMAKYANERVASAVLSVVDSVRMIGQRLAVDGPVTMNNLTLNATPTDASQNTNYPLGLDKTGRISIMTSTQFRRLIVGNNAVYATDSLADLMASGRIHGAALWLNSYVPVPTTGTGLYMTPYSTGTDFLISNYNWGASTAGRLSINGYGGGTIAIGTLGFPSDATVSLYVPTKTLLGGLLVNNNTLPSGSGMGFQYQSGVGYIGNTGGGHLIAGFGADVLMAKNGTWDSFSDFQANGNSYFTGTMGISQSPVATVRLGIAAGTSLIAPLRLFGAAHTTAFNDGAINYNTTHRITVDSIGKTDSIAYLADLRTLSAATLPTLQQVFNSTGGGQQTLTKNDTLYTGGNILYIGTGGANNIKVEINTGNQDGFKVNGGTALNGPLNIPHAGASDANYTFSQNGSDFAGLILPTITANRTLTMNSISKKAYIINKNTSAFSWLLSSNVYDAGGTQITSLQNGCSYEFTFDGTNWILAGFARSSTSGVQSATRTITTSSTITTDDHFIDIDASGGNVTITLPAASSCFANGRGQEFIFSRSDISANTITIQRNGTPGTDLINGASNFTITTQYGSKTINAISTSAFRQY